MGEGVARPLKWVPTKKYTDMNLKFSILFRAIFKNLDSRQFW